MKEKHPIDSFFKDKLAERQYTLKEEYWASASALIEAKTARKRRRFLWLFICLGLVAGFSVLGYLNYRTGQDPINQDSMLVLNKSEPEEKDPGAYSGIINPKAAIESQKEESQKTKIPNEDKPSQDAVSKGKFMEKGQSSSELKNTKKIMEFSEEGILTDAQAEKLRNSMEGKSRTLNALASEFSNESPPKNIPIPTHNQNLKQPIDAVFALALSQKKVLLPEVSLEDATVYSSPPWGANRRHRLGLEFGFALNDAIGSKTEQTQSLGLSSLAGISYRLQLSRNLSLLSAVRYTQLPSLAGDSTYTSTSFSFGIEAEHINIRPLSLHQLELPVSLNWQLGPRSSLTAGSYFRYLINVQSEVARYDSNPFETQPGPVNKAWGYKQGFEKLDLGLQLGYFYQLSEGLHLGIETQYGLRDMRNNSFYRETSFDRNLNARLVVRYDFARF